MRALNRGALWLVLVPILLVALSALSDREAAAQQPDVLICGDGPAQNNVPGFLASVQRWVEATGRFTTVDTFDIVGGTPPLDTLQKYDAVMVFTNTQPADRTALGNNLATYVDGGGGVVECQGVYTVTWGPGGSWTTHVGLTQVDNVLSTRQTLGTILVPGHPILANVTGVENGFLRTTATSAINGSTVIAEWTDGTVLLAANETLPGRVASVNVFPMTSDLDAVDGWDPAATDTDELIADALVWAANLTVQISSPAAGALPAGEVNTNYSVTFTASGGTEPYTWTVNGTLPDGLALDPDSGILSGVPTTPGSYSFDITVTDQVPDNDTRSYTIEVYAELLITSPAAGALPDGALNAAYGPVSFTATGGSTPYTWSISSLPPGMTFDTATGELGGTPTAGGSYSFDITVTDPNNFTDTRSYTLDIIAVLAIASPAAGALPSGYVNDNYSVTFTATGGTPGYSWSSTGALPPGLSLDPGTGVLSGIPTTTGSWSFSITVTDQVPDQDTRSYTLDIVTLPSIASPAPGALSDGTQQAPTSYGLPAVTFTASDGVGPYTWSATGLPTGLSINASTSEITGVPGAGTAGTHNITVTVTDANGKQGSADYTITINAPVSITSTTLPDAMELTGYSTSVAGSGGTPNYTWAASFNPPLADFAIDPSTGQITGTPQLNDAGTYNVTITYTDQYGSTNQVIIALTVKVLSGSVGTGSGCSCSATTVPATCANGLQALWLLGLVIAIAAVRRRQT